MIKKIEFTAFEMAQRFIGTHEVQGKVANPQILSMLRLDHSWPDDDKVPWCSGFMNYICWLLRLPRSKSLLARSWLNVGRVIEPDAREHEICGEEPEVGFDIVILKRGSGDQPGPENTTAPGHVGFFAGFIGYSPLKQAVQNPSSGASIALSIPSKLRYSRLSRPIKSLMLFMSFSEAISSFFVGKSIP